MDYLIYLTPLIFLILAGVMKALQDTISFHWYSSIFSKIDKKSKLHTWLNPEFSWQNKWKEGYKPLGEKFWGSSRWFVPLTDAWHLFDMMKTIFFICILTTFSLYIPFSGLFISNIILAKISDTIILFIVFSVVFEYFYNKAESMNK